MEPDQPRKTCGRRRLKRSSVALAGRIHGPYNVRVMSATSHQAPYVLDGLLHCVSAWRKGSDSLSVHPGKLPTLRIA